MNLRQHKWKLAGGAVVALLLFVALVWSSSPSRSGVRLTFLYATNQPQIGKVGVFELVNQLNESVSTSGGHYKPAKRSGLNAEVGDWGARIDQKFAAGTSNILHMWSPTNGGPYRLVLMCVPASKDTTQFYHSALFQISNRLLRWLPPPAAGWFGRILVESSSFEASP